MVIQNQQLALSMLPEDKRLEIEKDITNEQSMTDEEFIDKYTSKELGFPLVTSQGVYSSDSTSFADRDVPAVSFARAAPRGGATIHSRDDVLDHLSEENYYNSCNFIIKFSNRLINSISFPVEEGIPDNMKDELDKYLGRKEK